jgi:hypothetical protein
VPALSDTSTGAAMLLDGRDGGLRVVTSASLPGTYPQSVSLVRQGPELVARFRGGNGTQSPAAADVTVAGQARDAGQQDCAGGTFDRSSVLAGELELLGGRSGAASCTIYGALANADGFVALLTGPTTQLVPLTYSGGVQVLSSARDGWAWSGWRSTSSNQPVVSRFFIGSGQFVAMGSLISFSGSPAFVIRDLVAGPDGGSVYLVGDVSGANSGYGGATFPWNGNNTDAVAVKLSASGTVLWATNVGDPQVNDVASRAVLVDDQLIVSGRCTGMALGDGGRCAGSNGMWLVSLAP